METHYSKHLTYEIGLFLLISERPSWFTLVRALNFRWSVWKFLLLIWIQNLLESRDYSCTEYLVFPIYILGIIQINSYFLCWLLTGYSKPKYLWSNDLPSLSEGFLNWTSTASFMTDGKDSIRDHYFWVVILMCMDGFGQSVTEG